jgi:opacity protein-like surface antigen
MQQALAVVVAVSALLGVAPALAGEGRVAVHFVGRWASPVRGYDVDEYGLYKSGTSWGGGLDYAATDWLSVAAELTYDRLPFDRGNGYHYPHKWDFVEVPEGDAATGLSAAARLKVGLLRPRNRVAPYLVAGVAGTRLSHRLTVLHGSYYIPGQAATWTSTFEQSQKVLWLAWGAGAEIRMSRRVAVLVEGLRRDPLSADQPNVAGVLALKAVTHYGIGAGILLRL